MRLWLRERRKIHVVAVFAGTNPRFANFLVETDEDLTRYVSSSRVAPIKTRSYYPKGKNLYPPFHRLTTMGSCLHLLDEANKPNMATPLSDYQRAVYYGRPLFALLATINQLDNNLPLVLRRMLARK